MKTIGLIGGMKIIKWSNFLLALAYLDFVIFSTLLLNRIYFNICLLTLPTILDDPFVSLTERAVSTKICYLLSNHKSY